MFFSPRIREKGVFFKLGYEHGIRFGREWGPGYPPHHIRTCSVSPREKMCQYFPHGWRKHYNDVVMGSMASQITSITIVYPTVYSGTDQRKHKSSASLAFVRGNHQRPVNFPHKWPVTRKMCPFDDVIMKNHHL